MKFPKSIHRLIGMLAVSAACVSCATINQPPRAQTTIGAPVPKVTGMNQDGEPVDIAQTSSGEWAIIFFYPRADTPG